MILEGTSTPSEALYMVHLDNLERLVVDGPFHETMTLLNCPALPPRCSFDFTMFSATLIKHQLSSWETDPTFHALVAQYNGAYITLANNLKYMTLTEEAVLPHKCVSLVKDDPHFHIVMS